MSAIDTWGVDRLLLYEFKKSGIDRDSITIKIINPQQIEINFVWSYPDEKPKRRTVRLVHDDFFGAIDDDTKITYPQFDAVYIKSIPAVASSPNWVSRNVHKLIKKGGYYFIGGTVGTEKDIADYEKALTVPHLSPIATERSTCARMLQFLRKDKMETQRFDYGWRLYLFQYLGTKSR